jgi:hypothetical protein
MDSLKKVEHMLMLMRAEDDDFDQGAQDWVKARKDKIAHMRVVIEKIGSILDAEERRFDYILPLPKEYLKKPEP